MPFGVVVGREEEDAIGRGADRGGGEGGRAERATEPLFSATTLTDFSKTFQSLIVLSGDRKDTPSASHSRTHARDSRGPAAKSTRPGLSGARRSSLGALPLGMEKDLTIGGKEEVRGVLALAPPDLVDLLLDLQALEVVKLGFVALEFGVELVLASLLGLVALKKDDSTALVSGCEVVARVVELDGCCGGRGQARRRSAREAKPDKGERCPRKETQPGRVETD